MQILNVSNEEATKIYGIAVKIIKDEVKDKLKHPFKIKIEYFNMN